MLHLINHQNEIEFSLLLQRKFFFQRMPNFSSISLFHGQNDEAMEVKLVISDVYHKYYKAEIMPDYPEFMAILDQHNQIICAVGFRSALNNDLFLEQYLDKPIEEYLSNIHQTTINRQEIVEIGSLASTQKDTAKFLFIALVAYLRKKNFKYPVLTGTKHLLRTFRYMGLSPIIIAEAKQEKLLDKTINWGSYYTCNPQIVTGDLGSSFEIIKTFLGTKISESNTKLYPYV